LIVDVTFHFSRSLSASILAVSYFSTIGSGGMVAMGPPGAPEQIPPYDAFSAGYGENGTQAAGSNATGKAQHNVRYWNLTEAAPQSSSREPYEDWFLINPAFKNTVRSSEGKRHTEFGSCRLRRTPPSSETSRTTAPSETELTTTMPRS
jgi:hypothetical protein